MNKTFLFGAGASKDAGVPTTLEMTRTIYEGLVPHSAIQEAFNLALAGLHYRKAASEGTPYASVDVEELYATLARLADREKDFLAPFIAGWSADVAMVESLQRDPRAVGDALKQAIEASTIRGQSLQIRSFPIHRFQQAIENFATVPKESLFREAATHLRAKLMSLCVVDHAKISYLSNLITEERTEGLWIATLNYDDSIEKACDATGTTIELGLETSRFSLSAQAAAGRVRLAKLHGSINWTLTSKGTVEQKIAHYYGEPGIILGAGNKLQVQGPYLDLLFAFRERLEATNELHVCGYSFRDEHINHLLANWWQDKGASGAVVQVHDPGVDEQAARLVFPAPSSTPGDPPVASPNVILDRRGAAAWLSTYPSDGVAKPSST